MRETKKNTTHDFIKMLCRTEHELASWKYYKAINGKSVVATLFFYFLKYINDCSKTTCNDERDIYRRIYENLLKNNLDNENIVYEYLHEKICSWNDGGEVLLQYIQRINFADLPKEFTQIIEWFGTFDLSTNEIRENLVYAISILYASLYGELVFEHPLKNNDIYAMATASGILDCKEGMSLYDFSCGSGGVLALSASVDCEIYAQERDFEKAVVAYMYLKLSKASSVHIEVGDVLESPMTRSYPTLQFDRIICAPPMKQKYKMEDRYNDMYEQEFQYEYSLMESGFWSYARHIIRKLKNEGKAVLIAPVSVLSKEGVTKRDRKVLIEDGFINSIIQLPTVISSTSANLCMIVFRKKQEQIDDLGIFLADFTSRKSEKLIMSKDENSSVDYKKISDIVNNMEAIEGVSRRVLLGEFYDNDLNLTPAIYLRDMSEMMKRRINKVSILEKQKDLLNQYHESERKLSESVLNYYKFWGQKHNTGGQENE